MKGQNMDDFVVSGISLSRSILANVFSYRDLISIHSGIPNVKAL